MQGWLLRAFCLPWVAALAWACRSPVDSSSGNPAAVVGLWSYSATQTSPSNATLNGTLEITGQAGRDFNERLDVAETDAQGAVRRLSGVVSGRALDSVSVDFDAFLDFVARRHVGTLAGDSIRGTWVVLEPGGGTSSGSFRGARSSGP